MQPIRKSIVVGSTFVLLMGLADAPLSSHPLSFLPQATAGLIVAPVRRTAVVTSAASSSANAQAAAQNNAAAQANAQTAEANAAAANANAQAAAAAAAAPPAVGSMTTTLPAGCVPTKLNGVDYQRCGSTYYKVQMQGTNLVFVVAQP